MQPMREDGIPVSPRDAAQKGSGCEGKFKDNSRAGTSRSISSNSRGGGGETAELQNSQAGVCSGNGSPDGGNGSSRCAAAVGPEHQDRAVCQGPPATLATMQAVSHCPIDRESSRSHSGNTSEARLPPQGPGSMLHVVQLAQNSYAGVVGEGVTGYVRAYWFGNVLSAVKKAPLNSKTAQSVIHEACVYNMLKPLWGDTVPEVIEHGVLCEVDKQTVILATRLLRARQLDLDQDQDMLPQLLRQYEAIHALGVVQGDIRPYNILVQVEGGCKRTWIIDFGHARTAGLSYRQTDEFEHLVGLELRKVREMFRWRVWD